MQARKIEIVLPKTSSRYATEQPFLQLLFRRHVSILDDGCDHLAEQIEGIENVLGPKAGLSVCGRGTLIVKFRDPSLKGVSFFAWRLKIGGDEDGNTKLQFGC
jgi:hypothetical protein